VVGAHGIRGNLKVHTYAASLSVYDPEQGIVLSLADGSLRTMAVQRVQPHGRGLLMALETVADRDQAESLIGAELFVDKSCLPTLAEDTFYWFELMGMRVFDTNGVLLGCLEEVIPTPGNDVYVVKGMQNAQPREWLIPAIGDVILKIDPENKKMIVDPPQGL
jgi:16S rRNA processing protein RimM